VVAADRLGQRRPEVPAHERPMPGGGQELAGEVGGGRLAVGPGDRDRRLVQEPQREPQLAHDVLAVGRGPAQIELRRRDPGRHHDHVGLGEPLAPVGPELEHHAVDRVEAGPQIDRHHPRAPVPREPRGGPPRSGEPHDEHPLSGEISRHRHLSLRVDSPISASTMLMIQNRTMIFGSLQPSFS
jgi:hypothetical protein